MLFSHVIVAMAIVVLLMGQHGERRSVMSTPTVRGLLMVGSRRGDNFLTCMVERAKSAALRCRLAAISRMSWSVTERLSVIGRVVVTTTAYVFVSASLFIAQESRNIAVITRPSTRTRKSVSSWMTTGSLSVMSRIGTSIIHVRSIRRGSIHIMKLLIVTRGVWLGFVRSSTSNTVWSQHLHTLRGIIGRKGNLI
jgi:hypothetical protein